MEELYKLLEESLSAGNYYLPADAEVYCKRSYFYKRLKKKLRY